MMLALEREGSAQTWEGPWDWTPCTPSPCIGGNLYPEFAHAALIPTGLYRGKVLMWRREFDTNCGPTIKTHGLIFDPLAPNDLIKVMEEVPSELLCAGSSWDPSGRLVIAGGFRVGAPLLDDAFRFEPGSLGRPTGAGCHLRILSRAWLQLQDMYRPRFYPTIIALTKATIFYNASATACTSIVGGAHLVLGGPENLGSSAQTWSLFEFLPYGNKYWACPIDATTAPSQPPFLSAPAQYDPKQHSSLPPATPLPSGKLSSYPRAFQLSNGDVLVAHDVETAPANSPQEWFVLRFNQGGANKFEFWRGLVDATHPGPSSDRNYGTAVFMHMRFPNPHDRVIVLGGWDTVSNPVRTVQEFVSGPPATLPINGGPTVEGSWQSKPALTIERYWSGATLLPDGTILMSGGASQFSNPTTASSPIAYPEIYNPGKFPTDTTAGSVQMPPNTGGPGGLPTHRLYHSFSLLLPDGSVFIGGGEAPAPQHSGFNAGPYSGEIFQPPYMPQTTGLDMPYIGSVGSEQPMSPQVGASLTFNVTVENCRDTHFAVEGVVLTRPGAVTHFFDNDQRYIELEPVSQSINSSTVTLTVEAPRENLGPPGWYMLWVIVKPVGSNQRLPTHAEFVRFY